MKSFRTAGVLWLAAAGLSAAATIIFRNDSGWYAISLAASAVAAVLGITLLWRPNNTTVLMSTIGGVAWVALYAVLIAVQSNDIQAWTADAFFALLGGSAALIASWASRGLAT